MLFTCIWNTPDPNLNLIRGLCQSLRTYAEICTLHWAAIAYLRSVLNSLLAIIRLLSAVRCSLSYTKDR